LGVGLDAGFADVEGLVATAALTVSLFAESAALEFPMVSESLFMMESPASGGASGCLKKTGNRIETGTGCPWVLAGSNFRSREPFIAAESRALKPDVSATRVESATICPSRSMKIRSVTFPCTFWA
jgi:hypothetical protein